MESLGNKPRKGEVYICPVCGKKFYRQPSWGRTRPLKNAYCSRECANKGKIKKGSKVKLICEWCGKEFWEYKSFLKNRKRVFCSRECRGKYQSEIQRGRENPMWKNGISKLSHSIRSSKKWKEWRRAVFERDNYTCQFCGARSSKGKRVILYPDHITPFIEILNGNEIETFGEAMDCDELWDIDNGRTLCKKCHKERHR